MPTIKLNLKWLIVILPFVLLQALLIVFIYIFKISCFNEVLLFLVVI